MSDYDSDDEIYSNESINDPDGHFFQPNKFFEKKELCYYTIIDRYFKNECTEFQIEQMINIIEMSSDISLRILDWFASKYSKQRCKFDFDCAVSIEFDVRMSYDAQLKSFRKKYFDPFRRKKKILLYIQFQGR